MLYYIYMLIYFIFWMYKRNNGLCQDHRINTLITVRSATLHKISYMYLHF